MKKYIEEYTNINGPSNVLRLEGQINGKKKVMYLFMEHGLYEINEQTKCDTIFSNDIQFFLRNTFINLNKQDKTYDFFFDIDLLISLENVSEEQINKIQSKHPYDYTNFEFVKEIKKKKVDKKDAPVYKLTYFKELIYFFNKIFRFDEEKNKVKKLKYFKNIRLHYMDVMMYVYTFILNDYQYINNFAHMIKHNKNFTDQDNALLLLEPVNNIVRYANYVQQIIRQENINVGKEKIVNKKTDVNDVPKFKYIINKIKNSYTNDNVKHDMHRAFDFMDDAIAILENGKNKINKIVANVVKRKYLPTVAANNLYDICKDYLIVTQLALSYIDSINIARRFCDKKYINNAICYTMSQTNFISLITILVKIFNFNITHAYSTYNEKVKIANKKIKNENNSIEVAELISHYFVSNFVQCVSMDSFPDNFL
jgi:hypothetical protein